MRPKKSSRTLTLPNADHFFEQAERLIARASPGAPRQVDLRRAISNAYYGVFHATLASAANQFVGKGKQSTGQYSLLYRSIDHATLRNLCPELRQRNLSPKLARHAPAGGFGSDIRTFAAAVLDLQQSRHDADYDPSIRYQRSESVRAIRAARDALSSFETAADVEREAFLSLLVFKPR
jgi:hypothetical protein